MTYAPLLGLLTIMFIGAVRAGTRAPYSDDNWPTRLLVFAGWTLGVAWGIVLATALVG